MPEDIKTGKPTSSQKTLDITTQEIIAAIIKKPNHIYHTIPAFYHFHTVSYPEIFSMEEILPSSQDLFRRLAYYVKKACNHTACNVTPVSIRLSFPKFFPTDI